MIKAQLPPNFIHKNRHELFTLSLTIIAVAAFALVWFSYAFFSPIGIGVSAALMCAGLSTLVVVIHKGFCKLKQSNQVASTAAQKALLSSPTIPLNETLLPSNMLANTDPRQQQEPSDDASTDSTVVAGASPSRSSTPINAAQAPQQEIPVSPIHPRSHSESMTRSDSVSSYASCHSTFDNGRQFSFDVPTPTARTAPLLNTPGSQPRLDDAGPAQSTANAKIPTLTFPPYDSLAPENDLLETFKIQVADIYLKYGNNFQAALFRLYQHYAEESQKQKIEVQVNALVQGNITYQKAFLDKLNEPDFFIWFTFDYFINEHIKATTPPTAQQLFEELHKAAQASNLTNISQIKGLLNKWTLLISNLSTKIKIEEKNHRAIFCGSFNKLSAGDQRLLRWFLFYIISLRLENDAHYYWQELTQFVAGTSKLATAVSTCINSINKISFLQYTLHSAITAALKLNDKTNKKSSPLSCFPKEKEPLSALFAHLAIYLSHPTFKYHLAQILLNPKIEQLPTILAKIQVVASTIDDTKSPISC